MNIIEAILALSKMLELFDKWLEKFTLLYIEQKRKMNHEKYLAAVEKAKIGDVTDLRNHLSSLL